MFIVTVERSTTTKDGFWAAFRSYRRPWAVLVHGQVAVRFASEGMARSVAHLTRYTESIYDPATETHRHLSEFAKGPRAVDDKL